MNMSPESIKISRIIPATASRPEENYYTIIWIQEDVNGIKVDNTIYKDVAQSLFFLSHQHDWNILLKNEASSMGYILFLPNQLMNHPVFQNRLINEVRLFNSTTIPRINLAPGIAVRVQSILEMLDELIGSELNNKEEGVISLLNTFFVYCDGQCNIKSTIRDKSSKSDLVYRFKKLVNKRYQEFHEVQNYAETLNISAQYLNECVQSVLKVSAKKIIAEQLIMQSRHRLKFTNESIKEICFNLGFSSPDYFSSFFKNHTGYSPSTFRKL